MADWSPARQNAHAGPTGAIGCTRETSSLILALKVSKKLLTDTCHVKSLEGRIDIAWLC
jgi:hypothetical protein